MGKCEHCGKSYKMYRPHQKYCSKECNQIVGGKRSNLKRYGLTPEAYDLIAAFNDNKCRICGKPEVARNRIGTGIKSLAVDHDHETGQVRGLLCTNCNTALGLFKDDVNSLKKAVAYLEGSELP